MKRILFVFFKLVVRNEPQFAKVLTETAQRYESEKVQGEASHDCLSVQLACSVPQTICEDLPLRWR